MLRFEATLAYRHLRSGGSQTLLTVSAVAAGVIIVVFITSLIFGLRQRISSLITDLLPHIVVSPPETDPVPLQDLGTQVFRLPGAKERPSRTPERPNARTPERPPEDPLIASRIERQSQQRKYIENWPQAVEVIRSIPEVSAVAPAVTGQGFVSRGAQRLGVQVYGAVPEQLDRITAVQKYVFTGSYFGLGAEEILIGRRLAEDLGVSVQDRVRLTSTESLTDSFLIAGIYDTGQEQGLGSRVYINLRPAQSLYGTGTAVSTTLVALHDLFQADQVADRIMALLPYKAESWSRQNPDAVAGLRAQAAVAYLLSGFSLAASSFAIASVLIVSVLQKSKQIGILKSMGARSRQIMLVFTLEGLGIALVGATLGALLGSGVVWALTLVKQPVTRIGGEPEPLLPAEISLPLIAAAMLAATVSTVLAAILPARRAARLDPVEVMR
jgi:lipoprotein-releasing system permease protein